MILGKITKHATFRSSTVTFVFCRSNATVHHNWNEWDVNLKVV